MNNHKYGFNFLESIFYRGDEPSKKEETKQIIPFY